MSAPTTVLLAVLLLAAGLLAYDAVREDAGAASAAPRASAAEADAETEALGRIEARLAALERRLEAGRRELAALAARRARAEVVGGAPPARAFLQPPARGTDGEVAIAPQTLDALKAYVEEAQRRLRADHARGLAEASLDRLHLALGPEERERVLDAVHAYRARAETFWADMERRGITDREGQRAELARLRDAFVDAIRPIVGDEDLDRVVDGLIGRGSIAPGTPMRPRPWER